MKLSIFTTATNPIDRGDLIEAITCFNEIADEVIYVDGGNYRFDGERDIAWFEAPKMKEVLCPWPKEFSWEFIGEQFQRGYEACTGDFVIHADLDFIFHENDYDA